MVIPDAFKAMCMGHFHEDMSVIVATPQQAVADAVGSLSAADQNAVRQFLDKILASGNASEAKRVMRKSITELRFGNARSARAFLQLIRDALGEGGARSP
jgi:hypothetical protein